jgi:UDP-3-O-[3-hydroxymyristoyl] glucosamine N-acyltransferase
VIRPSHLTAGEVAELVGGELIGRPDVQLAGVAALDAAHPGELSFLVSTRYLPYFHRTSAGAVLVTPDFRNVTPGPATRIVVPDPYGAMGRVLRALTADDVPIFAIDRTATVGRRARWRGRLSLGAGAVLGAGATLGADCVIDANAIVGAGANIGDQCRVEAHAFIHPGAVLGHRVIVRTGAKVGGAGFGFARDGAGPTRTPHVGRCVIEDDVEIGANATVDRGTLGETRVGAGTKLDAQVHVGHNVRIGARCLIMAQVGIAGSTVVEDDVILAGQAGLADHLHVGRGARVAAQSGVIGDVPAGATVSGYPARPHRDVLRQAAALKRLAPLVSALERQVGSHDVET